MTEYVKDAPKTRARRQILWYICQFSLPVKLTESVYAGYTHFHDGNPIVGDLVAMTSMREDEFYLGWVHGATLHSGGYEWAIESVETGQIINWSNVGMRYYDRKVVRENPDWRWSNAQFEFKDRWNKICYENGAYIVLPMQPEFSLEDDSVNLSTRIRFGWSENPPPTSFERWKDVTDAQLLAYFKASEEYNEEEGNKRKAAREAEEQAKKDIQEIMP